MEQVLGTLPLPPVQVASRLQLRRPIHPPPPSRFVCHRCGRALCLCDALPAEKLFTQTAFHILQSRAERFNALCSGRIPTLALERCTLSADYDADEVVERPPLPAGAGVLYPGEGSTLLSAAAASPPSCLVVIDGTWSQAGRLLRKNAWLSELPRYALAPAPEERSNYRIRRQPRPECLSTVEAVARCLQALEPSTSAAPVHRLLNAFERLVSLQEEQIAAAAARGGCGLRQHTRRARCAPADALRRRGFGETAFVAAHAETFSGRLLSFTAARLDGSGDAFAALLQPADAAAAAQLASNAASRGDEELWVSREAACAPPERRMEPAAFAAAWRAWLRPGEQPALWGAKACRALEAALGGGGGEALHLKDAHAALQVARRGGRRAAGAGEGTLEQALAAEGEEAACGAGAGRARAARALAQTAALLRAMERVASGDAE